MNSGGESTGVMTRTAPYVLSLPTPFPLFIMVGWKSAACGASLYWIFGKVQIPCGTQFGPLHHPCLFPAILLAAIALPYQVSLVDPNLNSMSICTRVGTTNNYHSVNAQSKYKNTPGSCKSGK
ncbi:hypothetical protein EI94DRAFT_277365 [Lactarius quietus]|nr:hypothetical protein EI94DRAFT_277365 [Lactarius quietus]